jgi:hypothetical protein
MSADIGPGDWVECVDASPVNGLPVSLVVGARYQIERVHDYLPHLGNAASDWFDCAVDLVGVNGPAPDLAWGLFRFRPIDRPTPEVVHDLLSMIDDLVPA